MTILDAVAGPILLLFPVLFIVFFVGAIAVEGLVIQRIMKRIYKKSFVMSLYANGASLFAGLLSIQWIGPPNRIDNFVAYFVLTLMVEFGVLLLITKGEELKKVALSTLLMNLISYGVLALIFMALGEF